MKIFFTFENPLPSREADAEVFLTTAKYLARLVDQAWLHVPTSGRANAKAAEALVGMPVVGARAPLRPAALRHFCCGLTVAWRREFRAADVVYTRNLWIAWIAVLARRRVVFDHYRPWPSQIPLLQPWIYHLFCSKYVIANIAHSNYTKRVYQALGVPAAKLFCVHNGFEPSRLLDLCARDEAKRRLGIESDRKVVLYTGRINRKKGLELVLEAARALPALLFVLVGSYGEGEIEAAAKGIANVRIVPWQPPEALAGYISAADILLIPPSLRPIAEFGSTVLPLKVFFYMGCGRAILAGDTPDLREVLEHKRNAFLCRPDCLASFVAAIETLAADEALAGRLATQAKIDARGLTWSARAAKIAAIIEDRMEAPSAEGSGFGVATWARLTGRWAVHFAQTRSWVLPPEG